MYNDFDLYSLGSFEKKIKLGKSKDDFLRFKGSIYLLLFSNQSRRLLDYMPLKKNNHFIARLAIIELVKVKVCWKSVIENTIVIYLV